MYIAHFRCFRNDVIVLGNNFAILRYPKFVSREQRVSAFTDLFLKNILREFIFVNLTKTAETAKTLEHQYHWSSIQQSLQKRHRSSLVWYTIKSLEEKW